MLLQIKESLEKSKKALVEYVVNKEKNFFARGEFLKDIQKVEMDPQQAILDHKRLR